MQQRITKADNQITDNEISSFFCLPETLEEASDVAAQFGTNLGGLLGALTRSAEGLQRISSQQICLFVVVVVGKS